MSDSRGETIRYLDRLVYRRPGLRREPRITGNRRVEPKNVRRN